MARRFIPITNVEVLSDVPNGEPINNLGCNGLGTHQRLITKGLGGPSPLYAVTTLRQINVGQSGLKRKHVGFQEVIVWAKLIKINGLAPVKAIMGWVRVKIDRGRDQASVVAKYISTRVRKTLETARVIVTRIK